MAVHIRAITFDVFGTLLNVDGATWTDRYAHEVSAINHGSKPYRRPGELFAELAPDWSQSHLYPDVLNGLHALKDRYVIAPMSNAGEAVGAALSAYCGLDWSLIIDTETAGAYKPDRRVYLWALFRLGLEANQVLHVAAHRFDLDAARRIGFKTALVERDGQDSDDRSADNRFDFRTNSLTDLAVQLIDA